MTTDDREYEWLPETGHWSTLPEDLDGRPCRTRGCDELAIAVMFRGVKGRPNGYRWGCCAEHMYGRRVVNGRVESRYLIGSIAHQRAKQAAER